MALSLFLQAVSALKLGRGRRSKAEKTCQMASRARGAGCVQTLELQFPSGVVGAGNKDSERRGESLKD